MICLDIQAEMLREARRRVKTAGLGAEFVRADATMRPLSSASVEHVYLNTVLGEIPDRGAMLGEIGRVLRPADISRFPSNFLTRISSPVELCERELTAAGFTDERTRGNLIYVSTWSRPA